MSQQDPIVLFSGVVILPNLTMPYIIEYLKRYCTVDVLGDTLYVKKPGNDSTTYTIEFDDNVISKVRKIKDGNGNNLDDEILYELDSDDSFSNNDDIDYDDI